MLHVPDVTGLDLTRAALAYAAAGWFVLPTDRQTKHAGSVLGKGWPNKSSRDEDQISVWFTGSAHGLALHVGRSGAVAFDVDRPEELPPLLRDSLSATPTAHQSTRLATPGRGHYLYIQPLGADLGNGKGVLQGVWGDIRGRNGVIMAEPSAHEKQSQGGRYAWECRGDLAVLPAALLLALDSSANLRRRPGRVLAPLFQQLPDLEVRHGRESAKVPVFAGILFLLREQGRQTERHFARAPYNE